MSTSFPQAVYDLIDDPSQIDLIRGIMERYQLPEDAFKVIAPIQDLVVEGTLDPVKIPDRLKERLKLSDEVTDKLARDVVKELLLPLRTYIPSIDQLAKTWNLDGSVLSPGVTPEPSVESISSIPLPPSPVPLPPRVVVRPTLSLPVSEQEPETPFEAATITKEDEEEILALKSTVESLPASGLDLKGAVMEVIKQSGLEGLSPELISKANTVIETRLRNVRDPYTTRHMLETPVDAGGVGLSGEVLIKTLEVLEDVYGRMDASARDKQDEAKKAFVEERVKRFDPATESMQDEIAKLNARFAAVVGEEPLAQMKEVVSAKMSQQTEGDLPPTPAVTKTLTDKQDDVRSAKPKMQDITPPRRLFGPVEELEQMTLDAFRRLGPTSEDAGKEIMEIILRLQEESYARRLEGISAWRKSPLMSTYTSLLLESLRQGESLEAVLARHKSAGEDLLTVGEALALTALNGMLRN